MCGETMKMMIVRSAAGALGSRKKGRELAAILVAVGCALLSESAEAADVRIVMQTNTPSPVADFRYTDVGYVTLGDTGDVAFISRVRKDNEEKRVVFRENATSISPVAVPGDARPFGGTWAQLDVTPMQFRGQWLFFTTNDPTLGTAVFARGSLEASTQPLIAAADVDGATTVGPTTKFSANANRVLVSTGPNVVYSVHPNDGRKRVIGYDDPIPGETGSFARNFTGTFVDDTDRITCAAYGIPGGPSSGAGNFVLHGVAGNLQPLAWFKANPTAALEDVGLKGSIVARAGGTMFVGAPGSALTEAFQWGTGKTVAGAEITVVEKVRAISDTSFAFIGRELNGVNHAMVYEGGQVRDLAGPGTDAPGTGQKFLDANGGIGVNSKGQVVFRAGFTPGATGIFLYTPGKGVEYILGRGSKVDTIDVGTVGEIDNASIDENGRVGFTALHATQNVTALVVTGKPGAPQPDGADLELTAEQIDGEIVFHVKNLGPADAKAGTLTIRGLALETRSGFQLARCNVTNGDTVCDLFQGALTLKPGATTDAFFLPPERSGTRIEGNLYGVSDPNLSNNTANVTYEPKSNVDPIGEARDSCSLVRSRPQRGVIGGVLVGLVAAFGLGRRRRPTR
jgi:hypothetical protein